jgi:hypothetical protein
VKIKLTFYGPYKLYGKKEELLFDSDISKDYGIYLWTVKYKNGYLVDYIGETGRTFWQRMKEHLIETFGGNYRICDPELLSKGREKIIWNGLWRKETRNKIIEFIDKVEFLVPLIKEYINLHYVFLGPLNVDRNIRKSIEYHIAKEIINSPKPFNNLLPIDIRFTKPKNIPNEKIIVEIKSSETIHGLKERLIING